MAWFADLAGKAENLLNTLDEQTGAALRNTSTLRSKIYERHDSKSEPFSPQKKKTPPSRTGPRRTPEARSKSPPPAEYLRQSRVAVKQPPKDVSLRQRKSPTRNSKRPYDLNNCPRTLVEDFQPDDKQKSQQKGCPPVDLQIVDDQSLTFRMQNLEVENAMLKNEVNVMNKELIELLGRLRKTEDELSKNAEAVARTEDLEGELNVLLKSHKELTDQIKEQEDKINNNESANLKLEADLRHAHTAEASLQAELDKANAECKRLESDWKSYRARVKNTLLCKDKEIRSMQEGMNLTEDTKILIEQLETLKEEREDLTEAISRFRCDNEEMRSCMEKLEGRATLAERAAAAARDTAKDERAARRQCEDDLRMANKELKQLKNEYNQIIENLQITIREKETELKILSESPIQSSKTSALTLNVAEYNDNVDQKRIEYLTDMVVQKQGVIESLTADYNSLKIKLGYMEEELQSAYRGYPKESRTATDQSREHKKGYTDHPNSKLFLNKNISNNSSVVDLTHTDEAQVAYKPKITRQPYALFSKFSILNWFLAFYVVGLHFIIGMVMLSAAPDSNGQHA